MRMVLIAAPEVSSNTSTVCGLLNEFGLLGSDTTFAVPMTWPLALRACTTSGLVSLMLFYRLGASALFEPDEGRNAEFLTVFQPVRTTKAPRVLEAAFRQGSVELTWPEGRKTSLLWPK